MVADWGEKLKMKVWEKKSNKREEVKKKGGEWEWEWQLSSNSSASMLAAAPGR